MIHTYIPLKWKGSVEGGNSMSDWKQNIVKCYPLSCDFIRMEDSIKPYTKVGPRRHQVTTHMAGTKPPTSTLSHSPAVIGDHAEFGEIRRRHS
ncbi:hypothetical protein NEUTE2DRAFT_130737 [Neurospora tetrasperma FGSC 2509]|nr:hypothetical protein NEUTE2DRAFT_130737 [Neurospora tetrasperma FGSC 2509]